MFMKKGRCQGHEGVSEFSELLVKGEGRKDQSKTLFKHSNLIKFTSVHENRNSVLPKSHRSWGGIPVMG